MIRWCSYCQRYLGEAPPFESFVMTHGVCRLCEKTAKKAQSADLVKVRRIGSFYAEIRRHALSGDISNVMAAIDTGAPALGMRASDLFMGIIQPVLSEIGKAWEAGRVTFAQEHAFTALAEEVLSRLTSAQQGATSTPGQVDSVEVLLVCISGNFHSLGVRTLGLGLRDAGIRTEVAYPSLANPMILLALDKHSPAVLGMSVSLPEQRVEVEGLLASIAQRPRFKDLRLLIGGPAVKASPEYWHGLAGVTVAPVDIDELVATIRDAKHPLVGAT